MTNQEPTQFMQEIENDAVKKITDYGFNDEYGYYNDWAEGVRPIVKSIIEKSYAQGRADMAGEMYVRD